uniref:BPTI/Kunitz inhibitor domain-containing protein n=1 Tax=Plectus sambesii TaxID=2011161 RepID=A0A914UKJ1_9BILA
MGKGNRADKGALNATRPDAIRQAERWGEGGGLEHFARDGVGWPGRTGRASYVRRCTITSHTVAKHGDSLKGCKIGDKCDECVLGRSEGSKCLKGDIDAFPILFCNNETQHMEPEESAYLRCNEKKGVLQIERCPPINGISGIFDEKAGCVDPTASRYNQGSVAALACIQPQKSGSNPTEPRWWYNSVTATCQQFLWDPTATGTNDHSPNNFRTIEHCESYCRDTCPRGSPQWNTAASFLNQAELTGCQTTAVCDANFECTTIGSEQWCCPTASSICGVDGGRSSDLTVLSTPYDAGYLTFNTGPSVTRFYYSVEQGRCLDFAYNGGLGNFNNFFSREDCELFCSQLQCSVGNPLRIGDEPQRCTTDSNCPSTHRCVADQNVCCPRQQTVCSQPLRVGNCERSVRRYWYNAVTRDCEIFDFTGCQGNDNNFATLLDCQNFCRNSIPEPQCTQGDAYKDSSGNYFQCSNIGLGSACPANFECVYDGYLWGCCPTKTYTCSLSSDGGSTCGSGVSYKYHYNAQTQQCDTFEYNGCDGNSNNFASREACEEYCGVGGCPSGGQPYRDNSGQLVVCSTAVACPSTHECFTVTTGGSSINRCCPTRAYICGLPPQQGSNCGLSTLNRYYFNIVTSTCTEFNYYGCDGNANNFAGLAQCTNFCHSAACKAGDAAYINPNTMTPMECNASLQNQCPPNFDCVFDGLSSRHVCCGATDMGVCPSGEKAYMEPLDLTVRECLINVRGSCPIDYLCRFNVQRNRYYCCAPADNQLCPTGKALYRDPTTVAPIQCTLNSNTNVNVCPTSYACQSTISGAFQGYCCSQANICPNGGEFFVDEKTTMPRSCTMGSFVSCPTGFTCQSSSQSAADGFCCKETVNAVVDGCPPNEYVYMANGEITSCDPFNPPNAPCPTGYTCQYSTSNQRYQCCGAAAMAQPINSHGCPATQVAYLETSSKSTPRICTSATQDCPTGYFCQFSVVNTQFQCCGINGGCPSQSVAFIGVDGEAQQCKVGQSTCPSGFSCQRSKKGNMLCCTTGTPSGTSSDCLPNEALVNGLCMPQASVGEPCIDHAQCTGGSRCTGGACTCPPEQISSNGICASPCGIGKSLVNGQCVGQSQIGQACQSTAQCQGGSSCTDGICSCTRTQTILNNVCVPKNSTNPSASTCPISGHIPYVEPGTTNVRFCPPNVPGICPPNFSCQFSQTAQQNICCGALNPESNTNVCPGKALPYVVKGQPQICTGGRCVEGYTCLYSESARNYYCCSTTASGTSRDMKTGTDGCPRGNALLFPTTGTPVECNLGSNLCPPGYSCVENTVDGGYQCCTSAAMMNIRLKEEPAFNESFTSTVSTPPPTTPPQSPCPSYLVQVEYKFHDGKVMQRCERSCPSHQIPVHGICKDIKLKKYYEGEVEGNAMN